MRILVLNDLVIGGGVENVVFNLISYLSKKEDNQVTLISLIDQSQEFEKLYPVGVNYFPYDLTRPCGLRKFSPKWARIKIKEFLHHKHIERQKYDVVLALKEGPAAVVGTKFSASKKFAWVHVDYRYLYWTESFYGNKEAEIACMKAYNQVVCVSNAARDSVCQVIGDPGNLTVKYNPVNVDAILKKSEEPVDALTAYLEKRASTRPILVSVGRLCEQKGYQRLLDVCSRLNQEFDYELWIVGDGPDRAALERQIQQNHLTNVVLWGQQSNPYPFIRAGDWFVSGAIWESYGLALQEALVLGIPVFAATCPAFIECVSEKEAILVSNDAEEIYRGMHRILSDPQLKQVYAEAIDLHRTQKIFFEQRLKEIEDLWR